MKLINHLEKRFGRFAIRGLMRYLIVLYGAGFVIGFVNPELYYAALSLNLEAILRGQVWRIVTWLVYPPSSSPLWGIFMLLLYYNLGTTLENVWGSFRFNLFMLSGILFHILAAVILFFAFDRTGVYWFLTPDNLNMSIFLAFAVTFPDMEFRLYFVLPIKAKILAGFYLIIEVLNFVVGYPAQRVTIFLSLFNVVLFYFLSGRFSRFNPVRLKRKADLAASKIRPVFTPQHRCAVCGKTEKDFADPDFRYCSKCKGNKEYCADHIFTHIHVE